MKIALGLAVCLFTVVAEPATAGVTINLAPKRLLAAAEKTPEEELKSLGFSEKELESDPEAQRLLEKRSSMLQTHQYLGFATWALMTATLLTPEANLELHKYLGLSTTALYGVTAYYSLFAPKPENHEASGKTAWHKSLAWVHGVGMVLTPILGLIRYDQVEHGKPSSTLGKLHSVTAVTTYLAFSAALVVVTF